MARKLVLIVIAVVWCETGAAREDAATRPSLLPGETITWDQLSRIEPFLPQEFLDQRDLFLFEGMRMEIGPSFADYSPAKVYDEATAKYSGPVRVGPESSLENYRAGQPFPMAELDCDQDPQAGAKIAWNFVRRWEGGGSSASFRYTYWDRGEQLPLFYEGNVREKAVAFRPEPQYEATNGDLHRGERRYAISEMNIEAPFDSRGIMIQSYRYKSSFSPSALRKNDDSWVYTPTRRRVQRISSADRSHALPGTDFTMDDLASFHGIVPQYEWECLGTQDLLAPVRTRVLAKPNEGEPDFGPLGLSFANDRWELRHAIKIRMKPRNAEHPYQRKDLYLDIQTLEPLYSFAYDRQGDLWKILWHNHRWSEDPSSEHYIPWEGVPAPRDLFVVADILFNVQTETGTRIEWWNRSGTPLKRRSGIRHGIDVNRLTKGR